MKLCLLTVALLAMPLALAIQRPAIKVLYDSDYAISEGFDLIDFEYGYYDDFAMFETRNNKSDVFAEEMRIKGDLRKQNLSFALEAYPYVYEPDLSYSKIFCRKNTSESLRPLILHCANTIRMRNLTNEEREQLQQFKNERKGKETPFFKAVYKNKAVVTKSVGLKSFGFYNGFDFRVYSYSHTEDNKRTHFILDHDLTVHLPERSFVVESVPANSTHNCTDTDPADLKPYFCEGQIRLRRLRHDD